jgi:hypothetical protein
MINGVIEEEIPQKWCERKDNKMYEINVSFRDGEIDLVELVETEIFIIATVCEHTKCYQIFRNYPTYDLTVTIREVEKGEFDIFYEDEVTIKLNWIEGADWFYYSFIKEAIESRGVAKTQETILKELKERICKLL